MGKPAARIGDMHVCPMVTGLVPHVGGPISTPGAPNVLIGGMPAATVGSMCVCVGPPDVIVKGSTGVFIGGKPAARMGDMTAHGGSIVMGCPTVLIGETGGTSFNNIPSTPEGIVSDIANSIVDFVKDIFTPNNKRNENFDPEKAVKEVNPNNGSVNCGWIIDSFIARITGDDPNAVTKTTEGDGNWDTIADRHNTKFASKKDFKEIFDDVKNGGEGFTQIIGMGGDANAHVVVITNYKGTPMILEGQGGGKIIKSAEEANNHYNVPFYGNNFSVISAPIK